MEDSRPAYYQVDNVFTCNSCQREIEIPKGQIAGKCSCGGRYIKTGESYPARKEDWDERQDRKGNWYNINDL
jgi:hypothetical protein